MSHFFAAQNSLAEFKEAVLFNPKKVLLWDSNKMTNKNGRLTDLVLLGYPITVTNVSLGWHARVERTAQNQLTVEKI